MEPEPSMSLDEARNEMYSHNPFMLWGISEIEIRYFRQLEQHLAETGDEKGLVFMACFPRLSETITSLEELLPTIQHRDPIIMTKAFGLYKVLNLYRLHFERQFPDFKVKYEHVPGE